MKLNRHLQQDVENVSNPLVSKRKETSKIMIKATSPTLVGFQNKNTSVPDWRIQLQNSVRKRRGSINDSAQDSAVTSEVSVGQRKLSVTTVTAIQPKVREEMSRHRRRQNAKLIML